MSRPTKLTREIIQSIAANIYPAGNYFEVACELAGIARSTGYEWLAMAEHKKRRRPGVDGELLSELLDAIRHAEGELENAAIIHWRKAFTDDWRSVEAFLGKRFPERWKSVNRQEVTGADGGKIETKVTIDEISQSILDKLLPELAPSRETEAPGKPDSK